MHFQYDGSNERCPVPLVQLRVMLKKMKVNDSCSIKIHDQGSKQDIPKWLTMRGYNYNTEILTSGVIQLHIKNQQSD